MKIVLRPHLKIRLKERNISPDYPNKIISKPEKKYFDTSTNHKIAVKNLKYNGKVRPMVVSYDIINQDIQVITIYPTTDSEISNRIKKGRWIRNEKN